MITGILKMKIEYILQTLIRKLFCLTDQQLTIGSSGDTTSFLIRVWGYLNCFISLYIDKKFKDAWTELVADIKKLKALEAKPA